MAAYKTIFPAWEETLVAVLGPDPILERQHRQSKEPHYRDSIQHKQTVYSSQISRDQVARPPEPAMTLSKQFSRLNLGLSDAKNMVINTTDNGEDAHTVEET
eukprot:15367042-Ditylum_brightwellii.AAC.4